MTDTIRDPSANNYLNISPEGRAQVASVVISAEERANIDGNAYNLNTGVITLTSDADTPLMYVKNNEVEDMVVIAIARITLKWWKITNKPS